MALDAAGAVWAVLTATTNGRSQEYVDGLAEDVGVLVDRRAGGFHARPDPERWPDAYRDNGVYRVTCVGTSVDELGDKTDD
jgi:hypothetical protein